MSEVAAPAAPVAPAVAPVAPPAAAPAEGAPVAAQNPAESAPAPKGDATAPETPDQAEKRGTSRFERKIGRLHREAAEQKARAEFFEKKWNETQKPAPAEGAPTLAQFDYDPEKYADAKAEYAKNQAFKEHSEKQRTETVKQEHQRLRAGWEEKVERGSEKYDDFEDVVGKIEPGTAFTDAILEAENSEEIAYYLGKPQNQQELKRILNLHPRAQIREIGKIEAKLLAAPPKPQTPSQAPAPITPLAGTSAPSNDAPSEKDDMRTWMRKRNKQVHGR